MHRKKVWMGVNLCGVAVWWWWWYLQQVSDFNFVKIAEVHLKVI